MADGSLVSNESSKSRGSLVYVDHRINLIWEVTQSIIAISITVSTMGAGILAMQSGRDVPNVISVAFGMIAVFYFSRTNYAAVGNIGSRVQQEYQGR